MSYCFFKRKLRDIDGIKQDNLGSLFLTATREIKNSLLEEYVEIKKHVNKQNYLPTYFAIINTNLTRAHRNFFY